MTDVLLPHKLSELAQIALDDTTTKLEPLGISVNMSAWCRPDRRPGHSCTVCAAGAVMVARLGLDVSKGEAFGHEWLVRDFGEHNALALVAIDSLRQGQVGVALNVLSSKSFQPWKDSPEHHDEDFPELWTGADGHALSRQMDDEFGEQWREEMLDLIASLREAGL
jgi:hypothetical protein